MHYYYVLLLFKITVAMGFFPSAYSTEELEKINIEANDILFPCLGHIIGYTDQKT